MYLMHNFPIQDCECLLKQNKNDGIYFVQCKCIPALSQNGQLLRCLTIIVFIIGAVY